MTGQSVLQAVQFWVVVQAFAGLWCACARHALRDREAGAGGVGDLVGSADALGGDGRVVAGNGGAGDASPSPSCDADAGQDGGRSEALVAASDGRGSTDAVCNTYSLERAVAAVSCPSPNIDGCSCNLTDGSMGESGEITIDDEGIVVDVTGLSAEDEKALMDRLAGMSWPCLAGRAVAYRCSVAG